MATTSKTNSRNASAKPLQKRGTPGDHGNLTKAEITPLVLLAKDAFNHQQQLKRVEPGTNFNDWRRDMVMDRVGKGGISKLVRSDFREVKAMFLELCGREDEAFEILNKTGVKGYKPTSKADTWETCETYVALITAEITAHLQRHEAGSFLSENPPITIGWLLTAARQRTGKPSLTIDTMAERLDPKTLKGLLSHVGDHISLREGRAKPERRKARKYPKTSTDAISGDPF